VQDAVGFDARPFDAPHPAKALRPPEIQSSIQQRVEQLGALLVEI
jgi:hypothetical protein